MKVPAEKLRKVCDPESLNFETSADIDVKEGIVGQKKAFEALRVGVGVPGKDFNIFVAGSPDTGKTRLIKRFLEKIAKDGKKFFDWVYCYNFEDPSCPQVVRFDAGKSREFKKDVADLIALLRKEIPAFFETDVWKQKLAEKMESFEVLKKALQIELESKPAAFGFKIVVDPDTGRGSFVPVDPDDPNQEISPEGYEALTEEAKRKTDSDFAKLKEEQIKTIRELQKLDREMKGVEKSLREEEVSKLIGDISHDLRERYRASPGALPFFDSLAKDVIKNLGKFSNGENEKPVMTVMGMPMSLPQSDPEDFFCRYDVNVFIDNSKTSGVPVVVETNTTYSNLFGAVEAEMGAGGVLTTNFTNIKAGAFHRANGGYLIIPALNLLKQPFCWENLKRTIKDQELKIESLMAHYLGSELKSLKPQPIPFSGKIILIGESWLFHLLYEWDDQFKSIFKIKVELEAETKQDSKIIPDFLGVMAAFCKRNKLRPFDKTAAARLIDYLSELAESQKKFSLRLGEAENILKEADFWAGEAKKDVITSREIEITLRKIEQRSNQMESHLLEYLKDEILKVDIKGEENGQINGLVVYKFSDQYFGLPERITAQAGVGKRGIINIEEECKLAGPSLNKSVRIIAGYLLGRYGQTRQLSLIASLCFEQSYHGIDGDSASAAELFVILSALARVPIKQNLAITGSMNQKGQIQAIGGVNKKIRGFFRVCCQRGLTSDQGVIIPKDNLDHLMLPREIVQAVKKDKFHIYAISTAEEGIEYLTGLSMAQIDEKVAQRLEEINNILNNSKPEEEPDEPEEEMVS